MFWKKRSSEPKGERQSAEEPEQALDTLAGVLRAFGQDAFDTERATAEATRAECEGWVQRITVGVGRREGGETEFRRDWGGLRRYFSAHRAHERDYVTRGFGTMRETLQAFARCLATAVGEERSADERLGAQLGQLLQAFGSNDPVAIRRQAESVVSVAQEAMRRRRQREAEQIALLSDKIQALRDELQQARELAALDPLTQLYNRNALDAHLERVADLSFLLSSSPCLLMIDIDHFKAINDRYGHPVGDQVLRSVADAIVRQFLRREDFVARYGGEEFVVVIPDSTLQNARKRAERVREMIDDLSVAHPEGAIRVTISVGISCLTAGDDGKSWLARADAALYEAKARGRNAVYVSAFPAHSLASLRPREA